MKTNPARVLAAITLVIAGLVTGCGGETQGSEDQPAEDDLSTYTSVSNTVGLVSGLQIDGVYIGEPAKVKRALTAMGLGANDARPQRVHAGGNCRSYSTRVRFFGLTGKLVGTAELSCGPNEGSKAVGLLVAGTATYAIRSIPTEVVAASLQARTPRDVLFGISSVTVMRPASSRYVSDTGKVREVLRPIGNVLSPARRTSSCTRELGFLFERGGNRIASLYLCAGARGRVNVPLYEINGYGEERAAGMVDFDTDMLFRVEAALGS
ncbi:MAG: hypothetical protein U0174_18045 [Polyangiaceae bacterium]